MPILQKLQLQPRKPGENATGSTGWSRWSHSHNSCMHILTNPGYSRLQAGKSIPSTETQKIFFRVTCALTWRFNIPICKVSSNWRAESLWPTSSKASVASTPPWSMSTSCPPLCRDNISEISGSKIAGCAYGCCSTNFETS